MLAGDRRPRSGVAVAKLPRFARPAVDADQKRAVHPAYGCVQPPAQVGDLGAPAGAERPVGGRLGLARRSARGSASGAQGFGANDDRQRAPAPRDAHPHFLRASSSAAGRRSGRTNGPRQTKRRPRGTGHSTVAALPPPAAGRRTNGTPVAAGPASAASVEDQERRCRRSCRRNPALRHQDGLGRRLRRRRRRARSDGTLPRRLARCGLGPLDAVLLALVAEAHTSAPGTFMLERVNQVEITA
jgi:hypothetical protein